MEMKTDRDRDGYIDGRDRQTETRTQTVKRVTGMLMYYSQSDSWDETEDSKHAESMHALNGRL